MPSTGKKLDVTLDSAQVRQVFNHNYVTSNAWLQTTWRGVPVLKPPTDLWAYQEIISETMPDVLVETGTAWGGSALFYADIMEAMGHGRVISIDISPSGQPKHPRITYVTGNSLNVEGLKSLELEGLRCMVSLDSLHEKDHVLQELKLYSPLVALGCFLVCEDTHITEARPGLASGPGEALDEFMLDGGMIEFARDIKHEPALTFTPAGWLKRVVEKEKIDGNSEPAVQQEDAARE